MNDTNDTANTSGHSISDDADQVVSFPGQHLAGQAVGTGDADLDVAVSAAMEAATMLASQPGNLADSGDADLATDPNERVRFKPGYEVSDARILRGRLRPAEDGTATVTFRGQVADATRCWVEVGGSGRISLYAEVTPDDTTATEVKVALVPTGKRVPKVGRARLGTVTLPGYGRRSHTRIQSGGVTHVYLLAVDGTVDRVQLDADREARRLAREAARQAAYDAQDDADDTDTDTDTDSDSGGTDTGLTTVSGSGGYFDPSTGTLGVRGGGLVD